MVHGAITLLILAVSIPGNDHMVNSFTQTVSAFHTLQSEQLA
jgi:hypothetical protein